MDMSMERQQEPKKKRPQSFSAFDHQGEEIKGDVIASHASALLLVQDASAADVIWIVDNLEDVGVSMDIPQAEWAWRRISEWLAGLGRVASTAADERRSASLQSARDVCAYCGGRALAFFSSVEGPNEAGNYTHQHRTDKAARALCKASPIYSRLALVDGNQETK